MSKILLGLLFFLVGCIEAGESDLDGNVLTRGGGIDKNRFILEWLCVSITVRYMGRCSFVSRPPMTVCHMGAAKTDIIRNCLPPWRSSYQTYVDERGVRCTVI